MMGLDTPETCRGWRNILRISCASSSFSFTWLYRDARSTKHNIYNISRGRSEWKNALTVATVNMTICRHVTQLRMERARFSATSIKFYHKASHSRRWYTSKSSNMWITEARGKRTICDIALSWGLFTWKYRVIHKSLRDFRTRVRNNQDRHGRKEH